MLLDVLVPKLAASLVKALVCYVPFRASCHSDVLASYISNYKYFFSQFELICGIKRPFRKLKKVSVEELDGVKDSHTYN